MVNMKALSLATAVLSFAAAVVNGESNLTKPLSSTNILPASFKPPQVFMNANLVHLVNLEKGYPRESVNVVIENIGSGPEDEYYIPFTPAQMEKIGALEVRDKKAPESPLFTVEAVEIDPSSETQYYKVHLPKPLQPKGQQTISINYVYLSSVSPLPAAIDQAEEQFLVYEFSAYWTSSYKSTKQKTEVKFPSAKIPEYTIIESKTEQPQKQGTKFTYGPFGEVPAGAYETVRVRYEFTKPLIHVSRLERDIEVSHWGGNIAFEERYTLHNRAANLSSNFNRIKWASSQYYAPATSAIKELKFPLRVGSLDPYFTDVIGNVSTSRFRSNKHEANLDIKPRYPIFGGWNYPFRIGWDADLKKFLRKTKAGSYVLNVPFLEGPKQTEGVAYEHVELRVILPEGATNVHYATTLPISSESLSLHKTFFDTIGRTTLTLTARNLVDEARDREVIVTYEYPLSASLRKPLVIFGGFAVLFVSVYVLGSINTGISAARVKN